MRINIPLKNLTAVVVCASLNAPLVFGNTSDSFSDVSEMIGNVLMLVVIIVAIVYRKLIGAAGDVYISSPEQYSEPPTVKPVSESDVIYLIKRRYPAFDADEFKSKVTSMYYTLQEAWESKNLCDVKPFETENLFNMHTDMIAECERKAQTTIIDNVFIQSIDILHYEENSNTGLSKIRVQILAKQVCYTKQDSSGNIISGLADKPVVSLYAWTLTRKNSPFVKRVNGKGDEIKKCPNCGAPAEAYEDGSCEYCGSNVSNKEYDWLLAEVQKIR